MSGWLAKTQAMLRRARPSSFDQIVYTALSDEVAPPEELPPGYAMRVLTDASSMELPSYAFRRRFGPGTRCFVAMHGEDVAHEAWLQVIPLSGVRFGLNLCGRLISFGRTAARTRTLLQYMNLQHESMAYFCGDVTPPDFRRKGLHGMVIRLRAQCAREEGISLCSAVIVDKNVASRHSYVKVGFKPFCRVSGLWLAGVEVARITRLDTVD